MNTQGPATDNLLAVAVKRVGVFEALQSGPRTRSELEADLEVSRATAHRIVRELGDYDLLERTQDGFALTALGETISDEMLSLRATLETANVLKPFLAAADEVLFELDVNQFANRTVTTTTPGDPYQPVTRFMELLTETETLRGFDTTSIAPVFVDGIREQILGGMRTEIVYLPTVADQIAKNYPAALQESIESGELTLWTSEELPFGLALFDDRIGLGAYDETTGILTTFVDTDDAAAIEWGEQLFAHYRDRADRYEPPTA